MTESTPCNILLVYEEMPERTVIASLTLGDLVTVGLTLEDLASVHGSYMNATEMTDAQEKVHAKVSEAIFGKYDEDKEKNDPAAWASKIIFNMDDDEELNVEGKPPKIDVSGATLVVHMGFAL